jgi:uncharacterized protein YhhL (DUF1145 family)
VNSRLRGNSWLIAGGWLSLLAALLHVGVIIGGPDWYRFFGAGEGMARMAERGLWQPAIMTMGIAAILSIWALYAFAGAGRFPKLPLMRTALVLISAIYLARGLLIIVILMSPVARTPFNIWSSLIVLIYGVVYAIGTRQAWPTLSQKEAS